MLLSIVSEQWVVGSNLYLVFVTEYVNIEKADIPMDLTSVTDRSATNLFLTELFRGKISLNWQLLILEFCLHAVSPFCNHFK